MPQKKINTRSPWRCKLLKTISGKDFSFSVHQKTGELLGGEDRTGNENFGGNPVGNRHIVFPKTGNLSLVFVKVILWRKRRPFHRFHFRATRYVNSRNSANERDFERKRE
jgi:hypothetical protein